MDMKGCYVQFYSLYKGKGSIVQALVGMTSKFDRISPSFNNHLPNPALHGILRLGLFVISFTDRTLRPPTLNLNILKILNSSQIMMPSQFKVVAGRTLNIIVLSIK